MCRSIRQLHNFEPPATDQEVREAALQYVRKIAGTRAPSAANRDAFEAAVEEVAAASRRLLAGLTATGPARDREVERARAQARWQRRAARNGATSG